MNIENPESCGLGQEKHTCVFLTLSNGWKCGREIPGIKELIEERHAEGTMNAKSHPGGSRFPLCQPCSQD